MHIVRIVRRAHMPSLSNMVTISAVAGSTPVLDHLLANIHFIAMWFMYYSLQGYTGLILVWMLLLEISMCRK